MTRASYDPQKAHDYYERTKLLKGELKKAPAANAKKVLTSKKASAKKPVMKTPKAVKAKARIGRLRSKISKLKVSLSEVEAELSKKRGSARETAKKNSDGKTTAKERQDSQQYRDSHKTELASKAEKTTSSSSSKSSSSSTSNNSVSDSDTSTLEARASKIKGLIKEAQRQLSNANQELGQLAHSALLSDPEVNALYTQFKSAERIPSK